MHVAYVLCQGEGGIPHYTAELANAMSDCAKVSVLKPTETTADGYFDEDVKVHELFEPLNISVPRIQKNEISIRKSVKAINSYSNLNQLHDIDPDIVHLTASSELFPFLKYFLSKADIGETYPLVETFHTVDPDRLVLRRDDIDDVDANNPLKWLAINNAKNVLSKALPESERAHAVVHTKKHRQRMIDRGVEPDHISIIPHGAFELFHDGPEAVNTPAEENTILFFGNIVSSKGPDTLVKAVPYLLEHVPDVKIIFAGDGTFSEESKSVIDEYPEHFEVHNRFIPNEEVGQLFARSQIVSIPHRKLDAQSGAMTIAYSFGKPTVTTTVGEPSGLVTETGCGLVVPPNDPQALAKALGTILRNDTLRETMSANTDAIQHHLSWGHIANQHQSIYENMVDEQNVSTSPTLASK